MQGILSREDYTPQFSGHETFPLRYGWLKKSFDRVIETENLEENRSECWDDDAIARFGVGKNMVASMRHWAKSTQLISEPSANRAVTTEFGRLLFSDSGLDPYMEFSATLWLIHWRLAANAEKTTWFWAFNYFPSVTFERDHLVKRLEALASDRGWARVASATIRNDVACFIRTYVARQPTGRSGHDDALECPLTELGLIRAIGRKDGFRFVRGPKPTLGDGVFIHALLDFWHRYAPHSSTLSFEAITHAPGSPGRVFLFDEPDIADRLSSLADVTDGQVSWSETAGLRQVVRSNDLFGPPDFGWISRDYALNGKAEVAR